MNFRHIIGLDKKFDDRSDGSASDFDPFDEMEDTSPLKGMQPIKNDLVSKKEQNITIDIQDVELDDEEFD